MQHDEMYFSNLNKHKWILTGIMVLGGVLIGAGVADCIIAINPLNLDQAARGLTIFSAGLTIVVLVDNTKTQKVTEKIHQETLLRLKNAEEQLEAIYNYQQLTEKQLNEIKKLLQKS